MVTFRLGVDYGTSNTVAALRGPDGRVDLLLFDGSPLLPSGVFLAADGSLLAGRDAQYSARVQPERFEPAPKRCVDDGVALIGGVEVGVVDLIAATLRRVRAEAELVSGGSAVDVVLACPASWGARRRQVLTEACRTAGLPVPRLVPEPVAAAGYYASRGQLPIGSARRLLIYDLGAGTFDATVVGRDGDGFAVLATGGLPDTGGLDIDATIVAYLGAVYAERVPQVWQRLERPQDGAQRRHRYQLWDDVRTAKEMLSRAGATFVYLPGSDIEMPLGREQLDRIAAPVLRRTVTMTRALLRDADIAEAAEVALLLVGGGSRMPLVATVLHREFGQAPHVVEQPELVVALGAVDSPAAHRPERSAAARRPAPVASDPAPLPVAIAAVPDRPPATRRPVPAAAPVEQDEPPPPRPQNVRAARPGATHSDTADGVAHLVYLILPSVEGYTVRRYRRRWWDGSDWIHDEPAFLTRARRLLLFSDPGDLVDYLRTNARPRLRTDADWLDAVEQTVADASTPAAGAAQHHPLRGLVDEADQINLDLALYAAAGGPRLWAPELLVPARDLAAELAYALGMDDATTVLADDGPIDRLDELLRAAWPQSLLVRRRARAIDAAGVGRDWRILIEAIQAATTTTIQSRPAADA